VYVEGGVQKMEFLKSALECVRWSAQDDQLDRHVIGDAFEVFVLPFADDPELVPALEVVEPEPIEP